MTTVSNFFAAQKPLRVNARGANEENGYETFKKYRLEIQNVYISLHFNRVSVDFFAKFRLKIFAKSD
jgi:hypothetical protein